MREGSVSNDNADGREETFFGRKLRALAGGRGIWALGDQATLSLGNFLTNILLYRHFSKPDLGVYALLFSVILFFNSLHTSLVTYPLSITVPGDDQDHLRRRTIGSLGITLLLAIPLGIVMALVAKHLGGLQLVPAVLAALVLWQVQETLRRAMMARLQHRRAILGDAVSYLGQAVIVWFAVHHIAVIKPFHAFTIIAITSCIAAAIQAYQLGLFTWTFDRAQRLGSEARQKFSAQAIEHWALGRWVLLSSLIGLLSVYATPWVLAYYHGTSEVAAFQAIINLLNVSNPILTSISGLVVPAVAKANAERGLLAAKKAAIGYGAQGAALLIPYYLGLMLLPGLALRKFYGPTSPYLQYTFQLRMFVGVYAVFYCSQVASGFLNGLGKSRWTFYAQCASAAGNSLICLPLAAVAGLNGAISGGLIPMFAQFGVCVYFLRMVFVPPKPEPAAAVFPVVVEGT